MDLSVGVPPGGASRNGKAPRPQFLPTSLLCSTRIFIKLIDARGPGRRPAFRVSEWEVRKGCGRKVDLEVPASTAPHLARWGRPNQTLPNSRLLPELLVSVSDERGRDRNRTTQLSSALEAIPSPQHPHHHPQGSHQPRVSPGLSSCVSPPSPEGSPRLMQVGVRTAPACSPSHPDPSFC